MDYTLNFIKTNRFFLTGFIFFASILLGYLFYNSYTQQSIGTREGATVLHVKDEIDSVQTAQEIIAKTRLGSIMREFPEEFLDNTISEIEKLAKNQNNSDLARKAKKALKLLKDGRFKK